MSIYDNKEFFRAYAGMARSQGGLDAAGEWQQMKPMFPELTGLDVLDLGCGYGWHCRYAAECGAKGVLGLDASERMIKEANRRNSHPAVRYEVCGIEEYDYPEAAFDLVVSNLVLHYIEDLDEVYRSVYRTLRSGGVFLFNIEHPVFTAGVKQEWICDETGEAVHWPVDNYYYPGERETVFLGHAVKKQHHTLTQILNGLLKCGFCMESVEEAMPPEEMRGLPGMADEMRRPMMLLVKAVK